MTGSRKQFAKALLLLLVALALLWWGQPGGVAAKAHKKTKTKAATDGAVRDFYGRSIDPHVARLVREFNYQADLGAFDHLSLSQFKQEMRRHGLDGKVAHVGHVVSKKKGGPDQGANLMALPASDNWTLGEKIVPCDMAAYWNRLNVKCERLTGPFTATL